MFKLFSRKELIMCVDMKKIILFSCVYVLMKVVGMDFMRCVYCVVVWLMIKCERKLGSMMMRSFVDAYVRVCVLLLLISMFGGN